MKKIIALFSLLTITAVASYAGSACCAATTGKASDKKAPEQTVANTEQKQQASCPAGKATADKAKVAMAKTVADGKGCCKDDKGCCDSGKATDAGKGTTAKAGAACCAGDKVAETSKEEKKGGCGDCCPSGVVAAANVSNS